jgi:hypothetical protein
MPVKRELRHRYRTDRWLALSKLVRFHRAGGRCECTGQCGVQHAGGRCSARDLQGQPGALEQLALLKGYEQLPRVILAAAHVEHRPAHESDTPADVLALCQRCHLQYDQPEHLRARAARARRRRSQPELFRRT